MNNAELTQRMKHHWNKIISLVSGDSITGVLDKVADLIQINATNTQCDCTKLLKIHPVSCNNMTHQMTTNFPVYGYNESTQDDT
jgi:hypothetical protein